MENINDSIGGHGELLEDSQRRFLKMIEDGYLGLDGVMSPQSVALGEIFQASGIDMTVLWAITPQNWECPACGRKKEKIVRLNSKNLLMCRLVAHHDHMQNLLVKEFTKKSVSMKMVLADQAAERFAKRSAAMVSAFDRTIICNDCNNADTKAKLSVGTHYAFSYSPNEIRSFVLARDNVDHEIDYEKAAEIWRGHVPIFDLRKKIVNRIADIAATNSHWYQESLPQNIPEKVHARADNIAAYYQAYGVLDLLCGEKRVQPEKPLNAWRYTSYPKAKRAPTLREIEHVAKVTHAKSWNVVPDDWCCPSCGREKVQTVRWTEKNSNWTFHLGNKQYRDPQAIYECRGFVLCGDCGWVAEQLGKEAVGIAGVERERYTILVEPSEVAAIVIPRPNARHVYDNNKADIIVKQISERLMD